MSHRIEFSTVNALRRRATPLKAPHDASGSHSLKVHRATGTKHSRNIYSYWEPLEAPGSTEMHKSASKKGQKGPKRTKPTTGQSLGNSGHETAQNDEIVMSASSVFSVDHLLSVEEVAELLKVPVSWVYDRTRSRGINRIPGFRLGKYWRFRAEDVLAWIERQQVGRRPSA